MLAAPGKNPLGVRRVSNPSNVGLNVCRAGGPEGRTRLPVWDERISDRDQENSCFMGELLHGRKRWLMEALCHAGKGNLQGMVRAPQTLVQAQTVLRLRARWACLSGLRQRGDHADPPCS